jgi:thioredoxin reductase (NADPH)
MQFDLDVRTFERVTSLKKTGGGFQVSTDRRGVQAEHRAERVVLAVGDMAGPRVLGIPGEDLPHASHSFDEPHRYFRQRLLIVGGRNSAVEAAIRCHRAGARVSLSYRGETFPASVKYWLRPEIEGFIRQGHIRFLPRTIPTEISADRVMLRNLDTGAVAAELADFVLLLTGYVADTSLFEMAGVDLVGENEAPSHDPETMETNVPGLFVAGTAAAGTQRHFKLFIENSHHHVDRILSRVTGRPLEIRETKGYTLPES